MKKVLIFIESLSGGGAEKVLSDIVANLNTQKYEATVLTVSDQDIYQEKVMRSCKYRSILHKQDYNAGGIRKLRYWIVTKLVYGLPTKLVCKYVIREKYDVEIAFVEGYATKFVASSSNASSKKIAWVHTDMLQNTYADNYYSSLNEHREIYNCYNQIVCVSQSVKESFQKKFFASERVIVQYNPVDAAEILKRSQESIDINIPETLLFGTIGRLEKQKGYIRLLDCASKLQKEGHRFCIWIIGEGSLRQALEAKIESENLGEVVNLLGFQTNPYKYLARCDAFVCSSYAEGYSTAATESLVLGKPILTVNCAGMQELFGKYQCGEIVPNNDEALFQLLEAVLSKKVDLKTYKADIEKRRNEFDIRSRMEEIEELLK